MKRKTQFLIYTVLFSINTVHSQTNERLIYSHSLTSDVPTSGEQIENINGSFLSGEGWQADTQSNQLRIHLSETLPFEGTFIINVTNFDPVSQNVSDLKQHIINLYSRIYDNNKDIFETDGSWWNIRTGSNYSAGEGMAGFKFLAAPRGIDTREEVRCIEDATWDLSQIYEFKVVWTTSHIYCYLDDQLMATFNFHGQVEPFRYILIGKDNLIWGYCAQPGPIYSNLRIYGPGFPIEDTSPPTVKCFATVSNSVLRILFDEPVDLTSATNNANYSINHGISIQEIVLDPAQKTVDLHTTNHSILDNYELTISNIADTSANHNTLDTTIVYDYPQDLIISNISQPNYYVEKKKVGDQIYSDRNYLITSIPEPLADFEWIVTANDDKQETGSSFLTFCVNKIVSVVIGYDITIQSLPEWLQGWEQTEMVIQTEDGDFACYQKTHPPCEITLGGNAGTSSSSMYLILASDDLDTTPPTAPTGLRISRF